MATITTRICDIKGCENTVEKKGQDIHLLVKFTTEQTEGRSTDPHFYNQIIDLCSPCYEKLLEVYPLIGSGAQGYNDYFIKT